jgi:membrane fusion protein, macrolide-specific efflux system
MKKVLLIVLGVAVVGGTIYYGTTASHRGKQNARQMQSVQASIGSIEEAVEATGSVQPLNRVEIKPPIPGRIEKLLVDEGQKVRAGQVLGWMSSTDRAALLDAARAKGGDELKRWEDAYKPTPIIAPLSGTLILRNVVVGQTVDGGTVIYAMSDKLIVKADVDEADIGRVRLGMPAVITLDSYPNEPIAGTVAQILHEGINNSNVITYGVKIEPKTVPPFFRSLMTANIRLIANKKDGVLLLPAVAVQTLPSGEKQVTMRGPDGKPQRKTIEVGLETFDEVEVVSGLQAGDAVLVSARRYIPQQAAGSSPLVPERRRSTTDTASGSGRRRSASN